jgi:hypothetical protein
MADVRSPRPDHQHQPTAWRRVATVLERSEAALPAGPPLDPGTGLDRKRFEILLRIYHTG